MDCSSRQQFLRGHSVTVHERRWGRIRDVTSRMSVEANSEHLLGGISMEALAIFRPKSIHPDRVNEPQEISPWLCRHEN
jgi:hypothetical protein